MTFKEGMNLCFAWNCKKQSCRCLKETECKNGLGLLIKNEYDNPNTKGLYCKFYKPRSDIENTLKMKEFLMTSNPNYKKGKSNTNEKGLFEKVIESFIEGITIK